MKTVYLIVGSNLNKEWAMPKGLGLLRDLCEVVDQTALYEMPTFGMPKDAPSFFNAALAIRTNRSAFDLKFNCFRPLEVKMGRVRTADCFASRPFDVDLILYGEDCLADSDLVIPDSSLFEYPFVSFLLSQLIPDYCVPGDGRCISDICEGLHPSQDFSAYRVHSLVCR